MVSDSYRGCFTIDHFRELVDRTLRRKNGQQHSRTPLLHDHLRQVGIQRAGLQQTLHQMGIDLRVQIVDVRLEHRHQIVLLNSYTLPDHHTQKVRPVGKLPGARSKAYTLDMERLGCQRATRERLENARAGRGRQLEWKRCQPHRIAFQNLQRCRCRKGHCSMGRLDHAAGADRNNRRVYLLDPQMFKTDSGGDHIGDRVDGADFVEMDIVEIDIMDACLGDRDSAEDRNRALLDRIRKRAPLDHSDDLPEAPMRVSNAAVGTADGLSMIVSMIVAVIVAMIVAVIVLVHALLRRHFCRRILQQYDIELGGVYLAAHYRAGLRTDLAAEAKRLEGITNHIQRNPCIEQGTNSHIATDAGEAVEVRNLHGSGPSKKTAR